ncbi:ent-kaurene oxidase [Hypoxylon cercidicola]|nr:ent-kaurene oxidase [Hypoxylon cercidicola]
MIFSSMSREHILGILFLGVSFFAVGRVYFQATKPAFWQDQHVVGIRKEWFPWTRAALRSVLRIRDWVFEGYSKHSKANSFFVIPSIDRGPMMVVPPKQIRKVYGFPTTVLDVYNTANNTIQTKWTIWDTEVSENNFQMNLIRNQLTRNLDILTPPIAQELEEGLKREWGLSTTEWKYVDIWTSAMRIIGGAANSAFCGEPMCRNMDFLQRIQDHSMFLFLGSILISSTPGPLRFITGYAVGWACYFQLQRVSKLCLPFVKERLDNTAMLKEDPGYSWVPPKDGLQWIIEECYATGNPAQLKPERVLHRLVFINDISLHSTSYTTQNVILDLCRAEPSWIAALREESARVLKEAGGKWTRQAVTKLTLIDSTIRESMRLTPFNSVGLPRTVIDPHGIMVENGKSSFNVPYGTTITIPVEPIHNDDAIYPDAKTFKPFRFAQPGAAYDVLDKLGAEPVQETQNGDQPKPKTSATVDDAFLGFGFGKHACPGRFFALNEIKIFVAIMVLHYDLHPLEKRPKMTPIIWLNMPLFNDLRVGVRRRTPVELL